jgi:threonine dehydrogenase-like Zn-dependent dehydrogenase
MKALVKQKNTPLAFTTNHSRPHAIHAGDVIVQVALAGICRTDIYVARGWIDHSDDIVIGHEFCGMVTESLDERFTVGDFVACNPILPDLTMLGVEHSGVFAQYAKVTGDMLYSASGLSESVAAYVEPIAASLAPLKSKCITPEQKGLIIGDNRISHLTYQILMRLGYNVDIIELDKCYSIPENSIDYALETFTNDKVFNFLPRIIKQGGTLILKSRNPDAIAVNFYPFVKKEITLEALYYHNFIDSIAFAHQHGDIFEPLLGRSYPLEAFADAFDENEKGDHKIFFDCRL